MKNKGFTLAELMGVIVILGILLLLVVPNVVKSIKDSKQKIYNAQINNIKLALENWKNDHIELLPEDGESIYLTITQLKRDNYLDNDMKNPITNKMWPNDMLLRIQNNDGYQYEVLTNTGIEVDKYDIQTPTISFNTNDVEIIGIGSVFREPVVTLNASDGTTKILSNLTKTITGSGSTIQTTYSGVYQIEYTLTQAGIPIKAIHNVIVRDLQNDVENTNELLIDTTLYPDGTPIYFNPNTGKKCSESEATSNINSVTNTPTGVKNGCMKWYTFGDKENETEIRLLLNHNTTPEVYWDYSVTSTEPVEAKVAFENDVVGWKKNIRKTARFITANEVAHITKADSFLRWNSDLTYLDYSSTPDIGSNSWNYYFDGLKGGDTYWKKPYAVNSIKSDYSWLYDYTYGGMSGCKNPEDYWFSDTNGNKYPVYGYWTSSPVTGLNKNVWTVYSYGQLLANGVGSYVYGIRPVITISKALIK